MITARYWVDGAEVDQDEYVRVERSCGFRNSLGQPDEPATSWFAARDGEGRWHEGRMRESVANADGLPPGFHIVLTNTMPNYGTTYGDSARGLPPSGGR